MSIVFVYFELKFKIIEFVSLKMFKVLQAGPFLNIIILFIPLKLKQKHKNIQMGLFQYQKFGDKTLKIQMGNIKMDFGK